VLARGRFHARGLRARGLDARAAQEPAAPRRGLPPRGPERLAPAPLRAPPRGARIGLPRVAAAAPGGGGVRLQGDGVRWLGEVGDDELARLYRGARAVAYVSFYDGFGLPMVEAMAWGAAVVA